MGVLKSNKKGNDKGKKPEFDEQGMKKPREGTIGNKIDRTKNKTVRKLHIYTHEERHGKKEPLKPHPHHLKRKEKEGEESEEGEGEEGDEEISEESKEPQTKEQQAKRKQKQKQNEEAEIVAMDREAVFAKFKTSEEGLPEVWLIERCDLI